MQRVTPTLVAIGATLLTTLAVAAAANATDEPYNCKTHGAEPCWVSYGKENYVTNDHAIDYTHDGVCAATVKASTGKTWAEKCTSGFETTVCNGGEYELLGYGFTIAEGMREGNLAGTQNNYKYCTGA